VHKHEYLLAESKQETSGGSPPHSNFLKISMNTFRRKQMVPSRAISLFSLSKRVSTLSKIGCRLQGVALALSLLVACGLIVNSVAPTATAQSAVTGAISGVVTDTAGAAVPGAQVIVTDSGTDAKQTVITNAEGRYTIGLLKPSTYKITATSASLKSDTLEVTVIIGTTVPGDIKVTPSGDTTIVDVNATTLPLLDTQNVALATTFNEEQLQELPTPGGDVTTIAFTLPGVVVNAGGSYGNFSSDGLPGISNLFVLNGFDNQDPFLNLNNSGSSNLTLGQGELAEATVVQNGYNSQYGRAAGAVIQYTTKSGTNSFHGMADYNYNGTVLNANGWFNNFYDAARPHAVSNQWAANVGGPIIRDKVFFFADYEGLRYVLPGSAGLLNFPSPQFQAATLATVPTAAQSFYQQTFAAYQGAPSYSNATPLALGGTVDGGCGDLTGTAVPGGGTFGTTVPCMTEAYGQANNINKEWLFTGRGDWNISDKHKIYGRYKMDRGSQPTSSNFINPLFDAISIQPEYEGQFNDSYVISPTKTNVLVLASNWYTAYFGPLNPAASYAAYPWYALPDIGLDGSGTSATPGLASLGVPYNLTQGRNVTQYQIEDDFNWIHGKHTFKFGLNFRRDLVSDYDSQILTVFPFEEVLDLNTFYQGQLNPTAYGSVTGIYSQAYAETNTAHLALYNVGSYFQDEWQARPNLKFTMGVRIDRTGNPLCHNACFSAYQGVFPNASASLSDPYNEADGGAIDSANSHPFPKVQVFNFQPRFGFNYSLDPKTEIRGGVGLFSDLYPAGFLDGAIQNFPNYNAETVYSGNLANGGTGSVTANAAAANTAVQNGFSSGQNVTQIYNTLAAQGVPFTPPGINAYFASTFKVPEYLEYSLQFQRQLSKNDAIIVTYAGNYGYDGVLINPYLNAGTGLFNGSGWTSNGTVGNVSATPPDPSFTRVTSYTNNGHSNYNGGMVSYKYNGHGILGQLSYTYSHSLDMVSNGGEGEYFNGGSVTNQLTPALGAGNLNYASSDYDIRNNLVGDVVYEEPFKWSNKILNEAAGGWVLSAKTYYRSGEPFTLQNADIAGAGYTNLGTEFMTQEVSGVTKLTNLAGSNPHACTPLTSTSNCFDSSQFVAAGSQVTFGNVRRNALYGPHYANTDLSVTKRIVKTEGISLVIGANAYNAFNHANFAAPNGALGSSSFGLIESTVAPPTSPYGSFQGAAVTQRVLQVHGKITF
jgi:hypothetical protein